ncbi:MAG: dynamin family protein [Sumerlaeia bacterium]
MLARILNDHQLTLLNETRSTLSDLKSTLQEFEAEESVRETLADALSGLDDLFLLVVVGEFNSGKSTFINALVGKRLLKEGATPTTQRVGILRYGDAEKVEPIDEHTDAIQAPVEILRELAIVDTPGTNAIVREHEKITREFVPRSDLVLFVTSAVQAYTETERTFLDLIRKWGKRVVVVMNKADLLDEDEREPVLQFLRSGASQTLESEPPIFPVSAKRALKAKLDGAGPDDERIKASGFHDLEHFIRDTLDQGERIRLKLLSPLGVGIQISEQAVEGATERVAVLKDDIRSIEDIDGQLNTYRDDMRRDFGYRLAKVDNVLLEFEKRGLDFIEEHVRITRIKELMSKELIRDNFEHEVVADTASEVERRVNEILDWIVAADLRQWTSVMQHVEQRRQRYQDRMIGNINREFAGERARLLDDVIGKTRRTVESYDRNKESDRLAGMIQTTFATTLLGMVGGVGVGAALIMATQLVWLDVTGVALGVLLTVGGLYIIPKKRKEMKQAFRKQVSDLRRKVATALKSEFEREIDRSVDRIRDAIGPYTRFVRTERDRLDGQRKRIEKLREELGILKARVKTTGDGSPMEAGGE